MKVEVRFTVDIEGTKDGANGIETSLTDGMTGRELEDSIVNALEVFDVEIQEMIEDARNDWSVDVDISNIKAELK